MTRNVFGTLALASVICSFPLPAQSAPTKGVRAADALPDADSLAAITRRGRMLAEYDRAARLGGEAVAALAPDTSSIRRHLVRRTDDGWEVAFGALNEARDAFLVSFLATPGIQRDRWAATAFDPPLPDTGSYLRAARAIETAISMSPLGQSRPYDAAAIPAADGPWWWVYLYPAPVRAGVWPHGGDVRFRLSADGLVITDTRRLHADITEYAASGVGPESAPGSSGHPPALDVVPEDTDVFHVLRRRPSAPEIIATRRYVYRIDVDGSIRYVRTSSHGAGMR